MKTIETILREEINHLKIMVEDGKRRLAAAPAGRLRIMKKRGGVEYYYKSKGSGNANSNGRYLKKSEANLAQEIAQRDYDIRMVKNAEERIKAIDTFLEKYKKTSLGGLYQEINQCRRKLISAPVISDDEYIKRWLEIKYEQKTFADCNNEIITERGERVRSKSEKIIADKLYALGVPYRYEYPIILGGNIKIYPDFTILKMPTREEVYLEHLGMMDDSNYVDNVMYKLSTYERNGIYIGVNLFITHETSRNPLNTRALDKLIRTLFCVE